MSVYLLDTNAVSDLMNHHAALTANVAQHDYEIVTSAIVRGEIRYGLEHIPPGRKRAELQELADNVFSSMPCEPVDYAAADVYGVIRQATAAIGLTCDDNDLWIAATAIALDATVISRDKMMPRIPGLRVEDWTQ